VLLTWAAVLAGIAWFRRRGERWMLAYLKGFGVGFVAGIAGALAAWAFEAVVGRPPPATTHPLPTALEWVLAAAVLVALVPAAQDAWRWRRAATADLARRFQDGAAED
jgi:hypothetical protein